MKIIILGAGQVGSSLAATLIEESHDIVLVDTDDERLQAFSDYLDIQTVTGHCSYPETLREAGAEDADMIIAVTDNDEANMIACQVSHSIFQVPKKIARIRSAHYFIRKELFGKEDLPIDVFINPEQLVTKQITELISYPGTLQVLSFGHDILKLVSIKPYYGGTLIGKKISTLHEYIPNIEMSIVAIFRNNGFIPTLDDTQIEVGDEVYFIAATEDLETILSAFRRKERRCKKIIISGGGHIGGCLAAALQDNHHIKLIDHNRHRCEVLAEKLDLVTVLHAEANDEELLINENIENSDVFIAVTNDDETNIITSIQAKRLGVKQALTLITRPAYIRLIEAGSINIAISPQQATIGPILSHIRQGDVVTVHSLRHGTAEVIEAIIHGDQKNSKLVGRTLSNINLPKGTGIGAIIRHGSVIIPHANTTIESLDHIILFVSDKKYIHDVEKILQVGLTFF